MKLCRVIKIVFIACLLVRFWITLRLKLNLGCLSGRVRVDDAEAEPQEVPGRWGPRDGQHWASGQGRADHCGASHPSCCHLLSQPGDFVNINQLLDFFCANISSVPAGISQPVPIRSGTKGRSTTWRISRSRSTPAWLRPTVSTLIWGVRGGLV